MAVMRVHKTKDYTVMSNTHFREKEMSLKAKGLLSLMFSLPDSWDYSIAGLVAICKENETAITSTLKELKQFGYLSITKLLPNQTESGRIEYVYDIYETPQEREKQQEEKQGVENQGVVFQGVENQGQLSTKELTTNISNNNKSSTKNRRKKESNYDAIVDELITNEEVKVVVYEFIKMRAMMKKPLTDFALKRLLNKLLKISVDPQVQIAVLEKSIMNNWQDIYEPKAETTSKPSKGTTGGNVFLEMLYD